MHKKCIGIGISVFICLFFIIRPYNARSQQTDPATVESLQQQIQQYEAQLIQIGNQKKTLSSQISYLDTQTSLLKLQISQTTEKIASLETEIELLTNRTENLDQSITSLTQTMIERIAAGYKARQVDLFNIMLESNGFDQLLNKYKYFKTAQLYNQKLLVQVQAAKTNYEEQKILREKKRVELDSLKVQLNAQTADMEEQKIAKEKLLEVTQNSENTYQALLEKAQKELSGYSAFTQSQGGGLKSFGTGSNGWYFSQRDPAWGNLNIGNSSYKVWVAGCALTSVAMVCKSYGQNMTPALMALDVSKFIAGDLLDDEFSCNGKSTSFIGTSRDSVEGYVKRNIPVILRLYAPSVSGLHFIVAWKWDEGKNDFIIHDPYNGPDLAFSSLYSWSQVTNAIVIN